MTHNSTQFDWLATESAPEHYPMKIIEGTFFYRGEDAGLYIPSGGTLTKGWGKGISNHVVGPELKPLPDRLEITFWSLAENQFYRGDFELPYERILEMFREGVKENPDAPTYGKLMVGVAPGGSVAVWAHGSKTTEVFFGRAQRIKMDPGRALRLTFDSQAESDEYVAEILSIALTDEQLESIKQDGIPFGLWSRYRNHYNWVPTLTVGHEPSNFRAMYLNGEKERGFETGAGAAPVSRPLPRQVFFHTVMHGQDHLYIVHFDEFEIMEAFEHLGKDGQTVYLEFNPKVPRPQTTVRAYNDDESIILKKAVTEDW